MILDDAIPMHKAEAGEIGRYSQGTGLAEEYIRHIAATSTPPAQSPAARAASIISEESRVSLPMRTRGCRLDLFVSTCAAARPSWVGSGLSGGEVQGGRGGDDFRLPQLL